jgi:predicted AAA+ superfamily ATPase
MKRNITQQLQAWKEKTDRKPLIVNGARQVGKTYSLKTFGREAYESVAYINCDGSEEVANIFAPYYYSANDSRIEIDFLIQKAGTIIPLEVKAEENVHSKSLRTYIEKYPQLKGVRLSMLPYHDQDWMTNYPLYCVNFI